MPIYKNGKKDGLTRYRVEASYTTPAGEHKKIVRTAYGRDAALQLEAQLRAEAGDAPTAPRRMTVSQLGERYLAAKKSDVRATSLDVIARVFRLRITPILGDVRLDRLTPEILDAWKQQLAASGLSLATLRAAYSHLTAALNYAVRMDWLLSNPLHKIPTFRQTGAAASEPLHYYTAEQLTAYLRAARAMADASRDFRFYVFFALVAYTGARKGEANALRWSDVDGDVIHICRSVAQKLRGADVETAPKTASSDRYVQLPAPLRAILAEHRARQETDPHFSAAWHVCGGPDALRDSTIQKVNAAIAKAAGLPHIRVHDFRHTHATLLSNHHILIQEVARRLGHASVTTTLRTYAHLYPTENAAALAVLDEIPAE